MIVNIYYKDNWSDDSCKNYKFESANESLNEVQKILDTELSQKYITAITFDKPELRN